VTDKPLIVYIRVSISQQGRSGLGIEAQRETLRHTTTLVKRMRRFLVRFSGPVWSIHAPSLADFITSMVGF